MTYLWVHYDDGPIGLVTGQYEPKQTKYMNALQQTFPPLLRSDKSWSVAKGTMAQNTQNGLISPDWTFTKSSTNMLACRTAAFGNTFLGFKASPYS